MDLLEMTFKGAVTAVAGVVAWTAKETVDNKGDIRELKADRTAIKDAVQSLQEAHIRMEGNMNEKLDRIIEHLYQGGAK